MRILTAMENEREVVSIDETAVHCWQKRMRIWRPVDHPMNCYLQQERYKNITLIGAISTKSDEAYVECAEKTKKEYVIKFFENYLPHHRGALFILDNHKAHKSNKLRELVDDYGAEIAFLPPASSALNSIERLWSVVKVNWANYLIDNVVKGKDRRANLKRIVRELDPQVIRGINRSSHKMMLNVLEGHLV